MSKLPLPELLYFLARLGLLTIAEPRFATSQLDKGLRVGDQLWCRFTEGNLIAHFSHGGG